MAKVEVKMAVDPFGVVKKALRNVRAIEVPKIVAIDYDEEADILYVKFRHAQTVDNEALDDKGLILGSLNRQGEIVGLTIMEASAFN